VVRLDSKIVMQVKHLVWKFRGNSTISVDGIPVEVYWDVHNWLFGSPAGNVVFMFQTCAGADKSGSFADRSIVPWPYSQSSSFCLTLDKTTKMVPVVCVDFFFFFFLHVQSPTLKPLTLVP
jgi:hypothetical protein